MAMAVNVAKVLMAVGAVKVAKKWLTGLLTILM
jgi:hypothetical protein